MVTTVYFVRHGESMGNTQGFFQGHTNCELSENGLLQVETLKERCRYLEYDAIYSSPLNRTLATANAVNFYHKLPIIIEEGLIEINGGVFEGQSFKDLPKLYPEQFNTFRNNLHLFNPEDGESVKSVYDRIIKTVNKLVTINKGKTIVLVSHGCTIKNYLCYATSTPFEKIDELSWSDNTSISKINFNDDLIPNVEFMNDATHLEELNLEKASFWK